MQNKKNQVDKKRTQGGKENRTPRFPIWIYVVLFLVLIAINFYLVPGTASDRIKYSTFLEYVESGYVEEILITNGSDITGTYSEKAIEEGLVEKPVESDQRWQFTEQEEQFKKFNTTMLPGDEIRAVLDENSVTYDVRIEENWWGGILIWLVPIALIIAFWVFIFRRMNPGQQVMNIGKNKAALYDKQSENKVSFKDVAGLQEAKAEVEEIVEFLRSPKKFTKLGGNLPKGVMLVGPPGTGKTLLAKAVAGEAHVPFFSLSGSDFVEMFVGVGASRVRDLFKQAKDNASYIIFIDEIDDIGRERGKGNFSGSNNERENTLKQLLTEMDGFGPNTNVIVIAATNRQDILDKALMRAGRFDRLIHVELRDGRDRKDIFEGHLKPLKKLDDDLDIGFFAKQTPGFSGADIANVCNEAALTAARKGKKTVGRQDFLDAVDRIIGGLEKRKKIITPEEKKIIAFHEAGHATVSWMLEHAAPLVKVTIVPRGQSLGAAWYLPEERMIVRPEQMLDEMCAALGGRAAEKIIFDQISTGALNDLEKVAKQAKAMITVYGLNEKIGNMTFYDSQGQSDYNFTKPYSEKTAELIDFEISNLIESQYERALEKIGR